ncbi:hypothetical protein B0F90DRAFT_1688306 [Multifurca ochricompacta]|uniref:Uncharacterized protein n=1 Tax=Multifurca ochricompacta TaxID=376703 RepID=A0AAD4MBR6_9AGAM|nr:hypothetical protein B0F90DRAFT_1688306 [Multifurca ochricompacta]
MTNEELASLEPIIAQAWDQWDHQRRLHYAQQAQAAAGVGKSSDGHPLGEAPPPPSPYATAVDMNDAQAAAAAAAAVAAAAAAAAGAQPFTTGDPPQANDFRARFHRSLVAPSPFRSFAPTQQQPGVTPADGIDPHLGTEQISNKAAVPNGAGAVAVTAAVAIDPELGQARGEAEGVVGRLEQRG